MSISSFVEANLHYFPYVSGGNHTARKATHCVGKSERTDSVLRQNPSAKNPTARRLLGAVQLRNRREDVQMP